MEKASLRERTGRQLQAGRSGAFAEIRAKGSKVKKMENL